MARSRYWLVAVLGLALLAGTGAAQAQETQWQKNHPRRSQVNKRLARQNQRTEQGVKSGALTPEQGKQLHQEDQGIRKEERQDAAQNGGHITKQEQRKLNRQENRESRKIRKEKHPPVPAP